MTIDEAIEVLKTYNSDTYLTKYVPFSEALQLGVEALKAIQATREFHSRILPSYLPGETEEAHSSTG